MDFGTIADVRSRFAGTNCLSVGFTIDPQLLANSRARQRRSFIETLTVLHYTFELEEYNEKTRISQIEIGFDSDRVVIRFTLDGRITELSINGVDYCRLMPPEEVIISANELVPSFVDSALARAETRHLPRRALGGYPTLDGELRRFFKERLHGNVADETLDRVVRSMQYLPKPVFVERLSSRAWTFASWHDLVER